MNARYICQSPTEASEEPTSCIQNSEVHVPDPNWWKIAALQADCVLRRGSLQVKVREGSKFSSSGLVWQFLDLSLTSYGRLEATPMDTKNGVHLQFWGRRWQRELLPCSRSLAGLYGNQEMTLFMEGIIGVQTR